MFAKIGSPDAKAFTTLTQGYLKHQDVAGALRDLGVYGVVNSLKLQDLSKTKVSEESILEELGRMTSSRHTGRLQGDARTTARAVANEVRVSLAHPDLKRAVEGGDAEAKAHWQERKATMEQSVEGAPLDDEWAIEWLGWALVEKLKDAAFAKYRTHETDDLAKLVEKLTLAWHALGRDLHATEALLDTEVGPEASATAVERLVGRFYYRRQIRREQRL